MADKKTESTNGNGQPPAMPFLPYTAFPAMRDEMERMAQRFFNDDWFGSMTRFPSLLTGWPLLSGTTSPFTSFMGEPRAAMSESTDAYSLTVELPGLDENDIELTLDEGGLMLKAEKKDEQKSKAQDYHFTERTYGSIRRRFALPPGVDTDGMKADFSKGVLTVTLPKTEEAKSEPQRIPVNID